MKIDADTQLRTLLNLAGKIHDDIEIWTWPSQVGRSIKEYRQALKNLEASFVEDREERNNV